MQTMSAANEYGVDEDFPYGAIWACSGESGLRCIQEHDNITGSYPANPAEKAFPRLQATTEFGTAKI